MSAINRASLAIGLGLTAFLAACAAPDGEFPSLAKRPYEIDGPNKSPEAVQPSAPVALPPDLAAKVDALSKRHESADAVFQKGLPAMRNIAAKAAGTAPGTESWVNAHLELSRLDKARADSVAALGEFDGLIADQSEHDSAYVALLVEAQQGIASEVAAQRTEIDSLSRQIGE
jgi:hypothetical protein